MIGKLQGIIDYIGDDFVILMVNGVGYKVFTGDLPLVVDNKSVTFWIETIVREDSIRLFGFSSMAAQDLFNKLTAVSGVGPKVAMNILGAFKPETLLVAISAGDVKTITTAPGVGKKVAEKIILELKGKVVGGIKVSGSIENSVKSDLVTDLLAALESLGYRRGDVVELAQNLARENPDSDVGGLVRMALKEISAK